MREVYDDPAASAARGERGRELILRRFSLDGAAAFVAQRLSASRGSTWAKRRLAAQDARSAILRASHELEKGVGASLLTGSGRGPRSVVRRLLARAFWPYLEEQHRLDAMTLEAIASLQRSIDDVGRRLDRLEPED